MFNKLSEDLIISEISKVKNGSLCRIFYESELPLCSSIKKSNPNFKVIKIVETTVRTGVNYFNIQSVKDRKSSEENKVSTKKPTNNYVWVIKNKIRYNTNTCKKYVCAATIPNGSNTKIKYAVIFGETITVIDKSEDAEKILKGWTIPSYWNKGTSPEVFNVAFENIIRINNTGERPVFD